MTVEQQPDIILLTETWCNESTNGAALQIPGYTMDTELRRDRSDTGNGVGGGLLVYAKEGVQILSTDKFLHIDFNQFCAFSIKTTSCQLRIILVYRPPGADQDNTNKLCDILRMMEGNTIVIGDFNLPGIDWERGLATGGGRKLLETALEENLHQMVCFPTHIKGNTLDLILTNCPDKIVMVTDVGRLGKSDHVMLKIMVNVALEERNRNGTGIAWRRANYQGMKKDLRSVDWRRELERRTVQEGWDFLKNTVEKLTVTMFPDLSSGHGRGPHG